MTANPSTISTPMNEAPRAVPTARPEHFESWYARHAAALGYALAALVVLVGWLGRQERHIVADTGIGYWLGILGASLMGLVLLYPVRKRVRLLHRLGSTKSWFRAHMILGVIGPVLILYHCNFALGSLNSRVALFCTLLVAGSGLVGRYFYAKIHLGLYGSKASLQQLVERARVTTQQKTHTSTVVPDLLERMNVYDGKVLEPPQTLIGAALLPLTLNVRTRWAQFRLTWFMRRQLRNQAAEHARIAASRPQLERVLARFIAEHLRRVRRVASFAFYERMFSLWHLFHMPFFYILVLATIIHILAVHMY
ncbi:MAG: hypothetical protein OEQ25_02260 [Gammaproteobacteria bacterium]|nr:hypothetical protein [Gammaproteobacteria bacterium]MDH3505938.1 hypothetical protein [Gammaproteobacteria bacterium]